MTPATFALEALAALLEYPGPDAGRLNDAAREAVAGTGDAAALGPFDRFAAAVRDLPVAEREELFTRTFDLNPVCTLDIGWHLYGEQYERGRFLVQMRGALREHSIEESNELPDHLSGVLRLLARCDAGKRDELVRTAVLPALDKMLAGFEDQEHSYRSLLASIRSILTSFIPHEAGAEHHG